jgi:hypothetical protein
MECIDLDKNRKCVVNDKLKRLKSKTKRLKSEVKRLRNETKRLKRMEKLTVFALFLPPSGPLNFPRALSV